jgi:hypothetical protein
MEREGKEREIKRGGGGLLVFDSSSCPFRCIFLQSEGYSSEKGGERVKGGRETGSCFVTKLSYLLGVHIISSMDLLPS